MPQIVDANQTILVGRREAAQLLSISMRTVDNLIREKRLPVKRINSRVLFLRSDLEAFAKRAK